MIVTGVKALPWPRTDLAQELGFCANDASPPACFLPVNAALQRRSHPAPRFRSRTLLRERLISSPKAPRASMAMMATGTPPATQSRRPDAQTAAAGKYVSGNHRNGALLSRPGS